MAKQEEGRFSEDSLGALNIGALRAGKERSTPPPNEPNFSYKGIEITGISHLEEHGILSREDVKALIDKLPEGYFKDIPLGSINFMSYRMYSIERDGKVMYIKDSEAQPTDRIISRKRAVTRWNSEVVNDVVVPTDGKMTINVFSPVNWDGKNDNQLDKDTTLYSLSHELGHTIWGAAVYGPGINNELNRLDKSLPCSGDAARLMPFIEYWNKLPESTSPRYTEYKEVFTQEHKSDAEGHLERSIDELSKEEDFAVSFENYLYWGNLQEVDAQRFAIQDAIVQELNQ